MKNNRHELVFVLDQSASIENWIDEAPKALKALFKKQKKEQLETKTTITVFGSEYRTACENKQQSLWNQRSLPLHRLYVPHNRRGGRSACKNL